MTMPCMACPHPNVAHSRDGDGPCLVLDCPCHAWAQPTLTFAVADGAFICEPCGRVLTAGDPIGERLVGMAGETPVVEIVCVYCPEA